MMFNYIAAELHKALHRSYFQVTLCLSCLLMALVNIIIFITAQNASSYAIEQGFDFSLTFAISMLTPFLMMSILIVDVVFSDEYKFKTLRPLLSTPVSRANIFIGKIIAAFIILFILFFVAYLFWLVSAFILFHSVFDLHRLFILFSRLIAVLPLYLAGITLTMALAFRIPSSNIWAFVAIGIIMLPPLILLFVASANPQLDILFYGLLMTPFTTIIQGVSPGSAPADYVQIRLVDFNFTVTSPLTVDELLYCLILGIGWTVLSGVIGYLMFKKREL